MVIILLHPSATSIPVANCYIVHLHFSVLFVLLVRSTSLQLLNQTVFDPVFIGYFSDPSTCKNSAYSYWGDWGYVDFVGLVFSVYNDSYPTRFLCFLAFFPCLLRLVVLDVTWKKLFCIADCWKYNINVQFCHFSLFYSKICLLC